MMRLVTPTYYIIGADGFVGGYLYQALREQKLPVYGTALHAPLPSPWLSLDITDAARCRETLCQVKPGDIVIQTAACADVERCQVDPACGAVNTAGTKNVVDALSLTKARYVFFSSEYVFDGYTGPYDETALPRPVNKYGEQKLWSEHYIAQSGLAYLIVRTTTVYGYEAAGKNFLMSLCARLQAARPVMVPDDQISTPTFVEDLAQICLRVARSGLSGILNIAGQELLSRYDFAQKIARAFHLDSSRLLGVPTTALGQVARRPLRAGLIVDRLRRAGYTIRTTDDALTFLAATYGSRIRPNSGARQSLSSQPLRP